MKQIALIIIILSFCFVNMGYSEDNYALQFDGNSDYAQLPDSQIWSFGNNPFTIEFWVNFSSFSSPRGYQFFMNQDETKISGRCFSAGYQDASDQLWFHVDPQTATDITCPFDPEINKWYHLAFERVSTDSNSDAWRIFVDGQSQPLSLSSGVWNTVVPDLNAPMDIGACKAANYYLNGLMDEIRIWNYTRTEQELIDNTKKPLTGTESGLVGYWKLDEVSGEVIHDSSQSGLDGTIYGAQLVVSESPMVYVSETPALSNAFEITSGISYQNEGEIEHDDTDKLKFLDDNWAPTPTGGYDFRYYATGTMPYYWDAISANFDLSSVGFSNITKATLAAYIKKGDLNTPAWHHYKIYPGAINSTDEDSWPFSFDSIPGAGATSFDFSGPGWVTCDIPLSWINSNDFNVSLRLWNASVDHVKLEANVIPEPASFVLFGMGGLAMGLLKRRKKTI